MAAYFFHERDFSMEVRQATIDDVKTLVALNDHVQKPHSTFEPTIFRADTDDAELRAFFSEVLRKPCNLLFLAFSERTPVGYIWFEIQDRPRNPLEHGGKQAYVHHIAVDARVRRRGVASQLFSIVEEEARLRGINKIELDVWAENHDAQQFFCAQGFFAQRFALAKKLT
jgi:ribosomal protein S18 acetylase RimI-like enzyme